MAFCLRMMLFQTQKVVYFTWLIFTKMLGFLCIFRSEHLNYRPFPCVPQILTENAYVYLKIVNVLFLLIFSCFLEFEHLYEAGW